MTALLDRIVAVIAGFQSREANLRQQLAETLSDDAAADAQGQLDAIGTYLDQFVPALTDTEGAAGSGSDTAAEPADLDVVACDNSGADEIGVEPAAARSPCRAGARTSIAASPSSRPPVLLLRPGALSNGGPSSHPQTGA